MKTIKTLAISVALVSAVALSSSCNTDPLDLAPVDYYGSGNYWKTEAQVKGYIDGLHKNMRDACWTHTITFGELRGGIYLNGAGADGTTTSDGDIIDQKFDADHPGVSKFGNYYGYITNCNLFIARVSDLDESVLPAAEKKFFLGIAHGLRAFYYFDLYRIYGGVPLRLDVAVIDGELDPLKLYMGRSKASEVMTQIKADISKSLEYFGDNKSFNPYNSGAKAYWSKAATECLAAEVYLWNAKVSTGDQTAVPGDIDIAKTYCESLISNYGLKMLGKFTDVFDATKKGNDETIFAIRYMENEASNSNANYLYLGDSRSNTRANAVREEVQKDGSIKVVDWGDPCGLLANNAGIQNRQYVNEFFLTFDREDSRRNGTFLASYEKSVWVDNGELSLRGSHVIKNIGYINTAGIRVFCGDYIYYRLPEVYLMLAEIANYKGNNGDVEKYINLVRERAYGANWSDAHKYVAGDFTANELAILQESNFEFVQEGHRWWDLRRMTESKGGKHLVFCESASVDGRPVLKESEAYKVLWPLDKTILGNDPELTQTEGYK